VFNLQISTLNAAFEDAPEHECAEMLRDVANALDEGRWSGWLRDANGNRVGDWLLTDDN
jgi:hypothetical protein